MSYQHYIAGLYPTAESSTMHKGYCWICKVNFLNCAWITNGSHFLTKKEKKKKKRDFCNANMSHISGSWSILIVCDLAHILQWKKGKQINKKEQQLPELLKTIKNNAWKVDVEMRINEFLSSGSKKRKTKTTKEIEKAHRTHIYQNYRLIAWPELARG